MTVLEILIGLTSCRTSNVSDAVLSTVQHFLEWAGQVTADEASPRTALLELLGQS
jgi:hypothetical protein